MDSEGQPLVLSHVQQLLPPDGDRLTDRQLLDRYLSRRDEAAFTALVQRHGPLVYGVARRLLRDPHAAEDVFQATFLILASKAQTIRRQESLSSWLYGVAQRLAARVRQTGKRWETDTRRGVPMSQENPEAVVTQRELETVLDEQLKELPDRFRAPLLLCYLEGHTQDEAARRLGWSKATLRRRLERGRELLRARLLRRGVALSLGLLTTALVGRVEAGLLPALVQKTALASVRTATLGLTDAVSPQVAALAEWGMKTLLRTRRFLVFWLLAALLVVGGGVAAYAFGSPRKPPVVAPAPLPAADVPREQRAALSAVWSVAYSPDGRTLATGSGNADEPGTLALWDVPTGKVRIWRRHPRGVRSVAFSPDGTKVATACWDNQVRIYEVRTGRLYALLEGHSAAVNSVEFTPDGKTLASGSLDCTVILWNVEQGTETRRLLGHDDWVLSLAVFPDGKSLVSTGKDATVRIWDLETGQPRQVFRQPGVPIETVAVSPDGQTLVTGGWDHLVRLWDIATGKQRILSRGNVGVLFVSFSPDGHTLASASGNFNRHMGGEVKLWKLPGGEEQATLTGHRDSIWSVRFSPDSRTLATASRDQTVKIWDVASGKERLTLDNGLDLFDDK